jgi:hypothetical protein
MQLAGLGGLVYYTSNKNDPYITLKVRAALGAFHTRCCI